MNEKKRDRIRKYHLPGSIMSDICNNGSVGHAVHGNASVSRVANGIATDGCTLDITCVEELNRETVFVTLLTHIRQLYTLDDL